MGTESTFTVAVGPERDRGVGTSVTPCTVPPSHWAPNREVVIERVPDLDGAADFAIRQALRRLQYSQIELFFRVRGVSTFRALGTLGICAVDAEVVRCEPADRQAAPQSPAVFGPHPAFRYP